MSNENQSHIAPSTPLTHNENSIESSGSNAQLRFEGNSTSDKSDNNAMKNEPIVSSELDGAGTPEVSEVGDPEIYLDRSADFSKVSTGESSEQNTSRSKPNVPVEPATSNTSTPVDSQETITAPPQIAPLKTPRKMRTPAERALDQAIRTMERDMATVAAARAKVEAESRQKTYDGGAKTMHSLLLKTNPSTRDAVVSMLRGIADEETGKVLQTYLNALNSAPSEAESAKA